MNLEDLAARYGVNFNRDGCFLKYLINCSLKATLLLGGISLTHSDAHLVHNLNITATAVPCLPWGIVKRTFMVQLLSGRIYSLESHLLIFRVVYFLHEIGDRTYQPTTYG